MKSDMIKNEILFNSFCGVMRKLFFLILIAAFISCSQSTSVKLRDSLCCKCWASYGGEIYITQETGTEILKGYIAYNDPPFYLELNTNGSGRLWSGDRNEIPRSEDSLVWKLKQDTLDILYKRSEKHFLYKSKIIKNKKLLLDRIFESKGDTIYREIWE